MVVSVIRIVAPSVVRRVVVIVIIRGVTVVRIVRRMQIVSVIDTRSTRKWVVIVPVVVSINTAIISAIIHWPMKSSYSRRKTIII